MALINCPECGKQISDKAATCPNCGYPISQLTNQEDNMTKEIDLNVPKAELVSHNGAHTNWRKMGYREEIFPFLENKLSQDEVNSLFEKGILSPLIWSIFDGEFYNGDDRKSLGEKARQAKIHMVISLSKKEKALLVYDDELLLFTENYIFVAYVSTKLLQKKSYNGKYFNEYKLLREKCFVVPLSCIEYINTDVSIETRDKTISNKSTNVKIQEEKGNTIKGAVVGGVIAGPVGALVGATAASNNKTTKVNISNNGVTKIPWRYKRYFITLGIRANESHYEIQAPLFKVDDGFQTDGSAFWINRVLFNKLYKRYGSSPIDPSEADLDNYCEIVRYNYEKLYEPKKFEEVNLEIERIVLDILSDRNKKTESELIASNHYFDSLPNAEVTICLSEMVINDTLEISEDPRKNAIFYALPGVFAEEEAEKEAKRIEKINNKIAKLTESKKYWEDVVAKNEKKLFGEGVKLRKEGQSKIPEIEEQIERLRRELYE